MMEKRVLLAFALSVAVLLAYSLLFPQQRPKGDAQQAPPELAAGTGADETAPPAPAGPAERPEPKTLPVSAEPSPEKELVVDSDLYTAVLSSRGGVIKSWKLKKYTDAQDQPLEMAYFEGAVRPLLVVPAGMDPDAAATMEYTFDRDDVELEGDGRAVLTMGWADGDGKSVTKVLEFKNGTYAFDADISASGYDGYGLCMGESFGSLTARASKGYGHVGFLSLADGSVEKNDSEKLEGTLPLSAASGWVAVSDKYFIGALAPDGPLDGVLHSGVSDWGYVCARSATRAGFMVYAGPKDYDVLKAAGRGLDLAVDFGWFSFIAKPLFVALKFFHGLVGNYGWSIIIITVIIKLLFAPLTHKQQKSMKRMQKLQPKIAELKEKYKGDSQKMNAEMMELYKREKVNPLGGCLPMVIQIPVFIALYNVLQNAIELRQAPFMWWLTDLSAKDPYYILPVVMGLSMFAMQKMTPTTMDPKQAKIMMFMPVVLTFMFINLPSGLVLYFTLSNVLSMVQQLYINRTSED